MRNLAYRKTLRVSAIARPSPKSTPLHHEQKIHKRGVKQQELTKGDKASNRKLFRIRVRARHAFGTVKNIPSFVNMLSIVKVHCKGLAKNTKCLILLSPSLTSSW